MNHRLALICLAVALAGCTSLEKRNQASGSKAYLDAPEGKPLVTDKAFQPSTVYAIPPLASAEVEPGTDALVDIRPPSLVLSIADNSRRSNAQANAVEFVSTRDRIETMDQLGQSLWQGLLDFISQPGYTLVEANQAQNQLIVKQTSGGEDASKVAKLFRKEQPAEEKTFQVALEEDAVNRAWLVQVELTNIVSSRAEITMATLPEIERQKAEVELLNSFGSFYNALQEDLRVAKTAASDRIRIQLSTDDNGLPAFVADAGFDLVWQRLPQALQGVGFEVNDRNRALGTYFIAYSPPITKSFSLFGKEADEEKPEIRKGDYSVQVGVMGDQTSITFLVGGDKPLSEDDLNQFYTQFAELMRSPVR